MIYYIISWEAVADIFKENRTVGSLLSENKIIILQNESHSVGICYSNLSYDHIFIYISRFRPISVSVSKIFKKISNSEKGNIFFSN